MKKDAIISLCKKYRYQLLREWDEDRPSVLFIMLNPSTADANVDDPTICRVINFAKTWGYGGVYVGNLYAFRSTNPKALRDKNDPIGKDNVQHIQTLIGLADKVIYAWGRDKKEPYWLSNLVDTPYCIDISKKGGPKHPLYLKGDLLPKLYVRNNKSKNKAKSKAKLKVKSKDKLKAKLKVKLKAKLKDKSKDKLKAKLKARSKAKLKDKPKAKLKDKPDIKSIIEK